MPFSTIDSSYHILYAKYMPAKRQRGFTLIELMVTIAIIAVLATVGAVVYSSVQKTARISKRIQDLDALKIAVETYKASNGKYPIGQGAAVCIGNTAGTAATGGLSNSTIIPTFVPNYMQALPKDPSSSDPATSPCYMYRSDVNGVEYKIWTSGVTEMTSAEFLVQTNYIDPARDVGAANGGTDSCKVDGTTPAAWAVYSSAGTASTNACAF